MLIKDFSLADEAIRQYFDQTYSNKELIIIAESEAYYYIAANY